jgi:uncharacterized protein (TIGR03067 family)
MRLAALLLAVLAMGFAPAPFPRPDKGAADLKKIQGQWVQVAFRRGGDAKSVGNMTLEISGDRLKWFRRGEPTVEWAVKLNGKEKPGRLESKGVAGSVQGFVFRGVYRLEGNTLTICYMRSNEERERAKDFEDTRPDVWLEVFDRKKS